MDNVYRSKDDVIVEKVNVSKKKKTNKKKSASVSVVKQILNGEFLVQDYVVQNLGFVFFLFLMFLLVISKGYYSKGLIKDIETTQTDLDAKTAEYVESKARLEEVTRRDVLVRRLTPRGVLETTKPAKVIRVKREEE
jgi:hypothetical protein